MILRPIKKRFEDPMRQPVQMDCEGQHFLCVSCIKNQAKAKRTNPEVKDEVRNLIPSVRSSVQSFGWRLRIRAEPSTR